MQVITLVIFLLGLIPTIVQTRSEVEQKYGKPVPVYSVSEHIWMTPDYSPDGQVCRMRLYPKRLGWQTDYLGSQLLFPELKQTLNEIVPPHLRGFKKYGFGQTSLGGGTAWTTYEYENVSFTLIFSYKLDADILEKAKDKVITGLDSEQVTSHPKMVPSLDDLAGSKDSPTEIVIIRWNHKQCTVK